MKKTPQPPVTVFIDSNVLYDYSRIDNIDWSEDVFRGAPDIIIQLLPVNIRELNKHKDGDTKPRRAQTAASYLKFLNVKFDGCGPNRECELRHGARLAFSEHDEPVVPPLNGAIIDDHFVAGIQAYRKENPGRRTVLLTSDSGLSLQMKVKPLGVELVRLDQKYLSKELDDVRDTKIRSLERTIQAYGNRTPRLCAKVTLRHQLGTPETDKQYRMSPNGQLYDLFLNEQSSLHLNVSVHNTGEESARHAFVVVQTDLLLNYDCGTGWVTRQNPQGVGFEAQRFLHPGDVTCLFMASFQKQFQHRGMDNYPELRPHFNNIVLRLLIRSEGMQQEAVVAEFIPDDIDFTTGTATKNAVPQTLSPSTTN